MSDNVNIVSLITAALAAKDAEIVRLRGDHIENDEQSLCGCHSCEHYELVNAKAEIVRLRVVIESVAHFASGCDAPTWSSYQGYIKHLAERGLAKATVAETGDNQ